MSPLPNVLRRQLLLDALVDRHLVVLRRQPRRRHHLCQLRLQSLQRRRVIRRPHEVRELARIILQVVELGEVLVR